MSFSELGITDLTKPVAQLHEVGWAEVEHCLEPGLYVDVVKEAIRALAIVGETGKNPRSYLGLSPIDTPVNWHVANALSFQLSEAMQTHGYRRKLDFTSPANNAHLVYRRAGFEMESHQDEVEVGAVVSLCLLSGNGNIVKVEQRAGIDKRVRFMANRAVLFAGNDFGNNPNPPHSIPVSKMPRIGILLSHRDPDLWDRAN